MKQRTQTKRATRLAGAALLFSLTACGGGAYEPPRHAMNAPPPGGNSAVEIALAGRGDLSSFTQALNTTGVARELSEHEEYTIFAPTNAAFAALHIRAYPCFYSAQCRPQIAALLRNHIVPRHETVNSFSKWGGGIPTLGTRRLDVEEPFKDQYWVENSTILFQSNGQRINLLTIDNVIASPQELASFRVQPVPDVSATTVEKTVTTTRSPGSPSFTPEGAITERSTETTTTTNTTTVR